MLINVQILKSSYRDRGILRTAYQYLMSGLEKFAGLHAHHVVISGVTEIPSMPELASDYETRVIERYCDAEPFFDLEFSPDLVATALGKGDLVAINLYQGSLVGYGFTAKSSTQVTEQLDAILPPNFRYGYSAYTHPDHRGLGLARARWVARIEHVQVPQTERSIAYIATHNYPSLAMYYQDSGRPIFAGFVGYISIFGRHLPFNSPAAKRLGFRFMRSAVVDHGA